MRWNWWTCCFAPVSIFDLARWNLLIFFHCEHFFSYIIEYNNVHNRHWQSTEWWKRSFTKTKKSKSKKINFAKTNVCLRICQIFHCTVHSSSVTRFRRRFKKISQRIMELLCQNYISNYWHCTKNKAFLLRIPSVNVTKSVVSCGFGHIYWRNP